MEIEIEGDRDVVLEGPRIRYGKLHQASYRRWNISFKKELSDWGIRKVINTSDELSSENLRYQEMTLLVLPVIRNLNRVDNNNKTKVITSRGSRIVLFSHYAPLDDTCVRIIKNNNIVADCYQSRNLIILYFNPFPNIPRSTYFKNALDLVKSKIIISQNTETLQETIEEALEKNAKIFQQNIIDSEKGIIYKIKSAQESIQNAGVQITQSSKTIILEEKKLEAVKELETNFIPNFKKKIEELESQSYVKSVKISHRGVEVDVGEISIVYKKAIYYIGHILLVYTPTAVLVFNKNNTRQGYQHPHTSENGHSCFLDYQRDISSLLASLDLSKLTFMMIQFLKAYNSKSPIHKIGYWRTKEDIAKAKRATRSINQRALSLVDVKTNKCVSEAFKQVLADNNDNDNDGHIASIVDAIRGGGSANTNRTLINTPEAIRRRELFANKRAVNKRAANKRAADRRTIAQVENK